MRGAVFGKFSECVTHAPDALCARTTHTACRTVGAEHPY